MSSTLCMVPGHDGGGWQRCRTLRSSAQTRAEPWQTLRREAHVAASLGIKDLLHRKFLDADLPYELRVSEAALTE